jgi:hypothetical protein
MRSHLILLIAVLPFLLIGAAGCGDSEPAKPKIAKQGQNAIDAEKGHGAVKDKTKATPE